MAGKVTALSAMTKMQSHFQHDRSYHKSKALRRERKVLEFLGRNVISINHPGSAWFWGPDDYVSALSETSQFTCSQTL